MKRLYTGVVMICCLVLTSSIYAGPYRPNITQIGRYTTISNTATPAQINPLLAVAIFKFQPNVRTVGDAIRQVLRNTSYQLVPEGQLHTIVKETLAKPLPITVRTLGPIPIKDALVVLMGQEVFKLRYDPAHRLINFIVKPSIAHSLGVHHVRHQRHYAK